MSCLPLLLAQRFDWMIANIGRWKSFDVFLSFFCLPFTIRRFLVLFSSILGVSQGPAVKQRAAAGSTWAVPDGILTQFSYHCLCTFLPILCLNFTTLKLCFLCFFSLETFFFADIAQEPQKKRWRVWRWVIKYATLFPRTGGDQLCMNFILLAEWHRLSQHTYAHRKLRSNYTKCKISSYHNLPMT